MAGRLNSQSFARVVFALSFVSRLNHIALMSKLLTNAPQTPQETPPAIFDAAARRQRRARAAKRYSKTGQIGFFTQRCVDDAAERLLDIARTFDSALIIAPDGFLDALLTELPESKHPKKITTCYDIGGSSSGLTHAADDALPFGTEQFDLIISVLSLHSVNDLPGALLNIRRCLKPDGLMLGALFGGQTLTELRQSFYAAETHVLGAPTPRIFPMIDFSQAAALLQRTGFALPVVDTDRINIHYKSFETLISDLRSHGETNILSARHAKPISRKLLAALMDAYLEAYGQNDKFRATFEILWLTGWAPDASQQKPLKPGSAKMRLADALGATEQKL